MKQILIAVLTSLTIFVFGQTDSVSISGVVTDMDGNPEKNAMVMLKGSNFGDFVDTTYADKNGEYTLKVPEGKYSAVAAVNMEAYKKSKLEFWAYEIPAYKDLELDCKYGKLEVYGVNVFEVQGAYPGYMIYFRPMSLSRFATADMSADLIDIAPPKEQMKIQVKVNGELVNVNSIQRIEEFAGKKKMYAYLMHVEKESDPQSGSKKIDLFVQDEDTGDKGQAIYFKEPDNYKQ